MNRLFDAYIIVDWSAAARPVTGANSIWIGALIRDDARKFRFSCMNPKTRLEARRIIAELANQRIAKGDKVLIGFDFAFGYPAGTAKSIGLVRNSIAPWRAMYAHLAANIEEYEDNRNDRFALAASMNKALTDGPHPFWGVPKNRQSPTLSSRKGDFSAQTSLPEHRLSEAWIRSEFGAAPKSVWQLLGAGAVGSQSLLGIATIEHLRREISGSKIWPFETGFRSMRRKNLAKTTCVLAEIYPSTIKITPNPGEILDQVQVRMLSKHLESLDSAGNLASAFGPPNTLSSREIEQITCEEGWILAK